MSRKYLDGDVIKTDTEKLHQWLRIAQHAKLFNLADDIAEEMYQGRLRFLGIRKNTRTARDELKRLLAVPREHVEKELK